MKIIDGKSVSEKIRNEIKEQTQNYISKHGRKPGLAVIIAGDNPASKTYVANKIKACKEVGFNSYCVEFPKNVSEEILAKKIIELNNNEDVDGILVQLPLPSHLNEKYILSLIADNKDVDGFSAYNMGLLALGRPKVAACTPLGVIELLKSTGESIEGKHAVIIGRSNIVGKPMAMLLLMENATVTICHSKTKNLSEITKTADILIAAIGKPCFVKKDMVKEGAIVIDVGINRTEKGLQGDVDFNEVSKIASYITPVPGGVGPMTITMLLKNTLTAAGL